jgi:nucleoside-diphosphate-sugar epimerase
MRVLLTGAAGFIGRHAIASLHDLGFDVHAVSRKAPSLNEGAVKDVTWHTADLLDPLDSRELIERVRPSHLLHLAWYAEHGRFWTSTENVRWVEASLGLLRAFGACGGRRAVVAGTCAEYDWSSAGHCIEGATRLAPSTLYGACKHALNVIAQPWSEAVGVDFAWGRIFFLYGPWEDPARLVPSVTRALLSGQPALCSHGRQLRDFLHSSDVADAFVALLNSNVCGSVNIGSGEPMSIGELVKRVAAATGRLDLLRLGALAAREGEPQELVADVGRLRDEVGWAPSLSVAEGIERTVEWWREHTESSSGGNAG